MAGMIPISQTNLRVRDVRKILEQHKQEQALEEQIEDLHADQKRRAVRFWIEMGAAILMLAILILGALLWKAVR